MDATRAFGLEDYHSILPTLNNSLTNTMKQHPKPSEIIQKIIEETEFDYRDSCGANNCECYQNNVKLDAIIKYLDEATQPM